MGLFSKLFGKKRDYSKNNKDSIKETRTVIPPKLNIDTSQSSEKFQPVANELVSFLIEKLQEINILEKEIFERSHALKNPREPNQIQPGEEELWEEFEQRRNAITNPISLQPSNEGSGSFGKPTKYEYLNQPDTQIVFIMKSAKRAIIEIYYERGIKCKTQFVLRKSEDNWKIDTKKYGFQGETTWYKDVL